MENFDKNKYFNQFPNISVRDNELYFKDINLLKLAKENGIDKNSIKVCCADVIKDNILTYKNIVKNVIEKIGYKNKFAYAYASKVNYSKECLLTAYKYVDLVETSSPNDLMLYENLLKRGDVKTPLTIVCNGTKTDEYIGAIVGRADGVTTIKNCTAITQITGDGQPLNKKVGSSGSVAYENSFGIDYATWTVQTDAANTKVDVDLTAVAAVNPKVAALAAKLK